MEKTANIPTTYTNRQIWHIAYPILISLLMEQMIGMTDTAFLGRVGEVELGASAIAGVFYIVIFMVAFGFSIGSQILMARRNGEGEYREIGRLFYHGIYFQCTMAVVMFVLSFFFSPIILKRIISSPEIYEAATSYLHWRVFGALFSFNAVMFRAFFLGTTQTRTLTLNSIVMVLSNVVFNYILIFGNLGCPALGIAGAAIGSSLAEAVSLVFFIVYTRRHIDLRKYGLDSLPRFNFPTLKRMLSVSLWTMIQNCVSLSTWFLFFLYIEHLGKEPLAITNIVRSVSGLLFMMVSAFASTCGSLVSNLIGAGHAAEVPRLIGKHIRLAYLFVTPIAVLQSRRLRSIYTDMEGLRAASVQSLWVLCASYVLSVPAFIYFQSVSGTGNTRTALALELCALALYTVYITLCPFSSGRMDVAVCWTAEFVYSAAILLFSILYIRYGKWVGKQI